MKSIAVTGATSFIGNHLIHQLLPHYNVKAIVRPDSPKINLLPHHPGLSVFEIDMDEYDRIPEYLGSQNPIDAFIHLAWNGTRAHSGMIRNCRSIIWHARSRFLKVG